jgi:hypothetical protein
MKFGIAFANIDVGPDGGEEAAKLAEAGVDRCIVPSYLFLGETEATLAAHAERVIAPLA